MKKQGDLLFTLDIGTRTVIGMVLEYIEPSYHILASHVEEHAERSMLDGQIHNVNEVAHQVIKVKEKLEEELAIKLERVAIAAAGRALKTVNHKNVLEFETKKIITAEDVQSLEFSAVQKAQEKLVDGIEGRDPSDYHFVGYSIVEYFIDGMFIGSLEGQKARKIQANIIATFLPRVVVDSLLTVINMAGLEVDYLTLEPIAVASIVIPRDMYNFNIALVDIGAGTSDIALTKGGAISAYDMVPMAGDEITEALAEYYLLDYNTGERLKRNLSSGQETTLKNILSQEVIIKPDEAIQAIYPVVQHLASRIGESILKLNNDPPQVMICVGGGSLTPGLLKELAVFLGLPESRIGIKEYVDLNNVIGEVKGISEAQANTPIGIAVSSHKNQNKASFMEVLINGNPVQVFTLHRPTLADALIAAELDIRKLQGLPGMGLTCTVNGSVKAIRGELGQPGRVLINGEEVNNLKQEVKTRDEITFEPGISGNDACAVIADVVPELKSVTININGDDITINPIILQNGNPVNINDMLEDGADINYRQIESIRDGLSILYEISPEKLGNNYIMYKYNGEKEYIAKDEILVLRKGVPIELEVPLIEGTRLTIEEKPAKPLTINDILNKNLKDYIEVIFNRSQLQIPVTGRLYCNGEKVTLDKEINNGDNITYEPGELTVKKLFEFVNYKITPLFDNFSLTINGEKATLKDVVNHGDRVMITFGEEQTADG